MIYLDYAANCPVNKKVLEEFNLNSILYYANPNSTHKLGREAKKKIDEVSDYIAGIFGAKREDIIYTSGATESNNLAIKGFIEKYDKCHIIISEIEHSSIIAPSNYLLNKNYDIDILSVNKDGKINIDQLINLIDNRKTLISISSVESETGIVQDIEKIGNLLKKYENCTFHTDATGAIGKVDINYENTDMITFAPHKFYGISGIGVLIKKGNVKLMSQIHGGESTTIYRSGTPSLPLILSVKTSLELALSNQNKNNEYIKKLNKYLRDNLLKYKGVVINSVGNCIYNTLNFSLKGISSDEVAKQLEENDIYISTKSACSSKNNISKVVYAITKDEQLAKSTIRVSISHLTTITEIDEFLKVFNEIYKKMVKNHGIL